MRYPRKNRAGFSLIELIVVTVILSILAVTAIPAFINQAERRTGVASSRLASHIRFARELAMTTRRRTWVTFFSADNRYLVQIEGTVGSGPGNRIDVADPETGNSRLEVHLDQGDYPGIVLHSVDFGGRAEVEFDRLGQPYNGSGVPLHSNGSVILSAGGQTRTITVYAQTGLVKEE